MVFFDGFFEGGNSSAADAENGEEFVPEGFGFGFFAGFAGPFVGELDGVVADFVPGEGHGEMQILECRFQNAKRLNYGFMDGIWRNGVLIALRARHGWRLGGAEGGFQI